MTPGDKAVQAGGIIVGLAGALMMTYAPSQFPWLTPYALPVGGVTFLLGVALVLWGFFHQQFGTWLWQRTQVRNAPSRIEPDVGGDWATAPVQGVANRRRTADPSKLALIDQLYPQIYELSESDVDAFGNSTGDWRRAFLEGEAKEFFERMNREIQLLVSEYEPIRSTAAKSAQHSDIHNIVEGIAPYINGPAEALRPVREKAEALDYQFTEASLALVKNDVVALQRSIGDLRQHLSGDVLPSLARMRSDSMGS